MAAIAVVTSSPPATEGGHLVIARELVRAATAAGHDARLVVTPDHGFGRTLATYWDNWRADVGAVDQVISLRYPSYAVRHPRHVCWLNHTMREYYDLWPQFSASISPANRIKEQVRRTLIHAADRALLSRVTRVVAQSQTIAGRLERSWGGKVEVVRPPAPARAYRCDQYGSYVFTVSRLVPLKRVDLLVRALAEPAAQAVTAVVAGDGEVRAELGRLAASLGVADRIRFLGRIDDDALVSHLAACRAVCFAPFQEDYGFVTAEAFASAKAVVTARDSGGPTELVRDGETGLLTDPSPASLAAALARLYREPGLAERLGTAARVLAAEMTWPGALSRLLLV
jgi:glycosyltransferase involved in cell wall biosynthesis